MLLQLLETALEDAFVTGYSTKPFEKLHQRQLPMMEALAAAGYRPTALRNNRLVSYDRHVAGRDAALGVVPGCAAACLLSFACSRPSINLRTAIRCECAPMFLSSQQ